MPGYIHINGSTYELAAAENLNEARERLEGLANRAEAAAEFAVSLEGVRVALKVRADAVGAWAAFWVDDKDEKTKGRLRAVHHV